MAIELLTIGFQGQPVSSLASRVRLEQKPVSTAKVTMGALQTMLAMVRSGTSAKAYLQPGCEAYIIDDTAYADLVVYAWPSSLELAYSFQGDLVAVGKSTIIKMEREFDLVVPMADKVQMPFLAEACEIIWQTPCYNEFGVIVPAPEITVNGVNLLLNNTVFGVLRVRCTAVGHQYPLTFSMQKDLGLAITDLKPSVTAVWPSQGRTETNRLELALPGCLEQLLQMCPDGLTAREHVFGTVKKDEPVYTVYFSACTGKMIRVREEKP